jgi:Electron transfer DM13
MMTPNAITWLSRHKRLLIAVSIPVVVALWWAFRPEKLWINQRVNEAAPFDTSADPEPIFTGQFDSKAGGRVTVFKKPNGQEYLRLKDLTTSDDADADAHVELAKSSEVSQAQGAAKAGIDGIDLGSLKTEQGDQNYDLPAAADLTKYNAVVIYNKRTSAILGSAKLEAF